MSPSGVRYPLRGTDGTSGPYDPSKAKGDEKRAKRARQVAKGAPATRKARRIEEEKRRPRLNDDADAALRTAVEPFGRLDGFSTGAIRTAQLKADRGYIPKARLAASRLRLEMNRRK